MALSVTSGPQMDRKSARRDDKVQRMCFHGIVSPIGYIIIQDRPMGDEGIPTKQYHEAGIIDDHLGVYRKFPVFFEMK